MTRKLIILLLAASSLAYITSAQSQPRDGTYWKHSLSGEFVSEIQANAATSAGYTNNQFGWGMNYAYRPLRWLEFETGLEQVPGPTGTIGTGDGNFKDTKDQLYLVPFGARYVRELRSIPLQFSVGGGGAYLNHAVASEALNAGLVSVSGWGGQVAGSVKWALTRSKRIQLGASFRYYVVSMNPNANPAGYGYAAIHEKARFVTVGPDFTFSF